MRCACTPRVCIHAGLLEPRLQIEVGLTDSPEESLKATLHSILMWRCHLNPSCRDLSQHRLLCRTPQPTTELAPICTVPLKMPGSQLSHLNYRVAKADGFCEVRVLLSTPRYSMLWPSRVSRVKGFSQHSEVGR